MPFSAVAGSVSGPGQVTMVGGTASAGSINLNAGADLNFTGGTASLTVTGAGTADGTGGTLTTLAGTSFANLTVDGGAVSGTGTVTGGPRLAERELLRRRHHHPRPRRRLHRQHRSSNHFIDTGHTLANQGNLTWNSGYVEVCDDHPPSRTPAPPPSTTPAATPSAPATTARPASPDRWSTPPPEPSPPPPPTSAPCAVPFSAVAGSVSGPGQVTMVGGAASAGSINLNAGADLNFTGGTASLTVTGPGRLTVTGGTLTTLAGSSFSNLTVDGRAVSGTGTVTGELDWKGGRFSGAGTTTLGPSAASTISACTLPLHRHRPHPRQPGQPHLEHRHIEVCEAHRPPEPRHHHPQRPQRLRLRHHLPLPNGIAGSMVNTGTIVATTQNFGRIDVPLLNGGVLSVPAGASMWANNLVNLTAANELSGGTYQVAGTARPQQRPHPHQQGQRHVDRHRHHLPTRAALALRDLATNAAGASLTLQGGSTLTVSGPLSNAGTLGGSGTIVSSLVTNSGTVKPGGTGTGILNITGNYTQTAAGALAVDIAGTTVGTGFDRLAVSGTATLNGALNVTSPFSPGLGNNFLVLTAATRTGTFSSATGLTPGGAFSYTLSYSATGLTLVTSALPGLQINSVAKVEGSSGTSNLVFTVTMSTTSASTVTVQYATANGTAAQPGDYTSTSGTLTFTSGQTSKTVSVPIVGDTTVEPDETFSVNLTSPTNAVLSVASGTGTITNDDFSADLGVTVTTPSPIVVGTDAVYQASVVNKGPTPTTGVKLTDVLPAGTTLDAAASSAGCTGTTTVTCTIGAMATNGTATRTIALHTTSIGTLSNTITVSGDHSDPGPTANSASTTTSVVADQADLEVTQSGPGSSIVGSTETYAIWVQNRGLFDTTGVVLSDTLPAGSTFVSASPSQGTCTHTATTVTCPLGAMTVGSYAYTSIVVTEPAASSSVTNTASATSAKADAVPSNNSAAVTTSVAPLVASAGDDQVITVGDSVTLDASASSPLGAITSIDWNFGDGATGSGQVAGHTYARRATSRPRSRSTPDRARPPTPASCT